MRDVMRQFLASPRPAILEAVVDPNEPPMPARIKPKQAEHFAEALVRGQPGGGRIALTLFRDKVDDLLEQHDQGIVGKTLGAVDHALGQAVDKLNPNP